jgi:O-antigen/teichoic acid export membrane protein
MKEKKSLKLNFFMNAILTISSFIFPLITFPYVSRILLPVGTGKVAFATSWINFFAMIAQLGIPTYGIRACAKVRDNKEELTKTAQELMIINLIMSAVVYVALFVCIGVVPKLREDRILVLIVSMTIFFNAIGMEWLYKALEEYAYITLRSLIFKAIALIAMFALVRQQSDYVIYGGITIFAASASNIFNFIHSHRYISLHPVGKYNLKRHLHAVVIFFAMACATTVYTNLDTVMVKFIKGDEAVGYYNAAVKIKNLLVGIITSLGTVVLPRATHYIENNMIDEFKAVSKKAINFVIVVSIPLCLYFVFFAKEGIYFFSGYAYTGSIVPMQIIMPTLIFIGLTNILGIQILVPLGKEKQVFYSVLLGAIVDLIINAILIPQFASAGAAIGTVIAEFAVLLFQLWVLRAYISSMFCNIKYPAILLANAAAVVGSIWVKNLMLGNFFTLVVSAVLFFAIYGIILLVFKEPIVKMIFEQIMDKLHFRS